MRPGLLKVYDAFEHLALRHEPLVFVGKRDRHPAGSAPGNDRNLVHRVVVLEIFHYDRMAAFVVCGQPALLVGDHAAFLGRSRYDLYHGLLYVFHLDDLAALAHGEERRLVEEVLEVRGGEAAGRLCDYGEVYARVERLAARVYLKHRFTAAHVGETDIDLPVETARAQQRGVEDVLAVGRRHDDDALIAPEAVHLYEELV